MRLSGVSCASAADCVVVGQEGNHALAEHWDGTNWSLQRTPHLKGIAPLSGVWCGQRVGCTAVGELDRNDDNYVAALIEKLR